MSGNFNQDNQMKISKSIGDQWDMIRWFMGLHFKFNRKVSSPFWKDCNENVDLSGIDDYIDYYKNVGPITKVKDEQLYQKMNKDSIFSAFSYDFWMIAQGVETKWELLDLLDVRKSEFLQNAKINRLLTGKAVSMKEALNAVSQYPGLLSLDGWFNPTFS
jgi:tryptophan halogenase